jgi:aldehyde reductase
MGESRVARAREIAALRTGLDCGLTLIDTAEMYAGGRAEEVVGEAIAGRRDEVFLASKVLPEHSSGRGTMSACERSLKRLRTDRLDLYLLHWRGSIGLDETMEALALLQRQGKIRHYGVSNLDRSDMEELWQTNSGSAVVTNQVLYNLMRRGIEWDLLPWLRERRIPVMAYSPLEQGRLIKDARLAAFALRHGMTAAQGALAWLLDKEDVIAIPKSADKSRIAENAAVLERPLSAAQREELNRLFPPPTHSEPLAML